MRVHPAEQKKEFFDIVERYGATLLRRLDKRAQKPLLRLEDNGMLSTNSAVPHRYTILAARTTIGIAGFAAFGATKFFIVFLVIL